MYVYQYIRNIYLQFLSILLQSLNTFQYSSNCTWVESAPFRTVSVKDAMSDLPEIKNGWNKEEMPYNSEPMSHFQRKVTNFTLMKTKIFQ